MLHRALLVLVGLSLALGICSAAAAQGAKKPNIVLILADDLGYADIGAQGLSKDVKTPNVDALAAAGVRFTSGYVSGPVCSPTRAGLLTGRYQQRFGHEFNSRDEGGKAFGLPNDQVTIAQALKQAGYATGMVGKWHLGSAPEMHPMERGFDSFFGFIGGAHQYDTVGDGKNALMRGTTPVEKTEYLTDAFGREATAFVEKHAGGEKPFFLYLAFNAVHTPMQAPAKYMDRFKDVTDKKRRTMLGMLSAMDDAVGLVTTKLEEKKVAGDTLIFFLSDNGGPTPANGSINTPLRGFKGGTHEGGIRVPFIVKWTGGKVPAGKVFDKPAIALDLFPTALAAAGAPTPEGVRFDGVDLLPVLTGQKDGPPHETLYWRFGAKWAIRDGHMKLVQGDDPGVQLFDLAQDIGEQKDLAPQQPDVVKQLQAKYDQWSGQMEAPRWKPSPRPRRQRQRAAP